MPVLKNPCQLKMANGDVAGPGGALILEQEGRGTNPFEEDLEEHEQDFFLGSGSPPRRIPSPGGGSGFGGDLFSGSPEGRYRRRATLEKLVGLSPFRLGKGRKEKPPGGEKGSERRSFLGRLMIPLAEGNQERRSPEKGKARRSSEDFSLLQRLNGRRKGSLCSLDCGLAEKENGGGGDTSKRMSFLKIGLGAKARRASLVEKPSPTEAAEPVAVPGELEPKPREPLSGESALAPSAWLPPSRKGPVHAWQGRHLAGSPLSERRLLRPWEPTAGTPLFKSQRQGCPPNRIRHTVC